jgi:hypothetical protein
MGKKRLPAHQRNERRFFEENKKLLCHLPATTNRVVIEETKMTSFMIEVYLRGWVYSMLIAVKKNQLEAVAISVMRISTFPFESKVRAGKIYILAN